jgi:hypothetical protein
MPDDQTANEAKLHKLGQRLRDGFAKQNPTSEKSLGTVRNAIREQWEKDKEAERINPPAQGRSVEQEPEHEGPEQDR